MKVAEILVTLRDGGTLRTRLCPVGVSLVPVEPLGLSAAEVARALRETLGARVRRAVADTMPQVQVRLEGAGSRLAVLDDQMRRIRAIREHDGRVVRALEANVDLPTDEQRLDAVLSRITTLLGVATSEDLLPTLAHAGMTDVAATPSPKELAFSRAHERARQLALDVRELDEILSRAQRGRWPTRLSLLGVLATYPIVLAVAKDRLGRHTMLWMTGIIFLFFVAVGVLAWRNLARRNELTKRRNEKTLELETARLEERDLGETVWKKNVDPADLVNRLSGRPAAFTAPAIVSRPSWTSADMTALGGLHRQVIVLLERGALLFDDEYRDVLCAFEPVVAATSARGAGEAPPSPNA